MLSPVPSVCRLSVTFVHRNQAIEIFGNVSTPFNTLAVCWHLGQGNPSVGGVKPIAWGVAEYNNFGPIERYISETVQDIGAKLVLITNRNSHMSFRLVPNTVTLDDPERRNSANRRVISPNSVAFWTDCVKKWLNIYTNSFCSENVGQRIYFSDISFMAILAGDHPAARALKWGTPLSLAKIWPIISHNLETVQDRR